MRITLSRPVVVLLAGALLAAGAVPVGSATAATTATTATTATQGTALPRLNDPDPSGVDPVLTASGSFYVRQYAMAGAPRPTELVRVSDGKVVRGLDDIPAESVPYGPWDLPGGLDQPTLSGTSLLIPRQTGGGGGGAIGTVLVTDAATGATTSTLRRPAGEDYLHAEPGWLLSRVWDPAAQRTDAHLSDAAGAVRTVTGLPASTEITWVWGDPTGFVLQVGTSGYYYVDVATARARFVVGTIDAIRIVLTTGRVVWTYRPDDNDPATAVAWVSRDGATSGRYRQTGVTGTILPYGTDIGMWSDDASGTFVPIDLKTATAATTPLVRGMRFLRRTGDGGLVVTTTQPVSSGRVFLLRPGASPRTLQDLPVLQYRANGVKLSGTKVAATFTSNSSSFADAGARSIVLGGSAWTQVVPPRGPGQARRVLALAGDVTMTNDGLDGTDSYHLSWTGGSRALASGTTPALGRGGQLVFTTDVNRSYDIATDVRTGKEVFRAPITTRDVDYSRTSAIDGRWIWRGTGGSVGTATLTGTDTATSGAAVKTVTVSCAQFSGLQVKGRFAVLGCDDGYRIADLTGRLAVYAVPARVSLVGLGDGFAAWVTAADAGDGLHGTPGHLTVVDLLAAARPTRDLGPSSGDFAVDDSGTARLVHTDETAQPYVVDLPWLTASAAPVAPTVSVVRMPPVGRLLRIQAASADTRTLTYDFRYRVVRKGRTGAWTAPSDWQGRSSELVTMIGTPGTSICVSARVHAGTTVSPWSAGTCRRLPG